ncbi:MAG TPA: hypothetical protein VI756_33240 [Blastocatellia bacterium]
MATALATVQGTASMPRNPHSIVVLGGDTYDTWSNPQIVKEVAVELATNQSSEGLLRVCDPQFKIVDKYANATGYPNLPMQFSMGFGPNLSPVLFQGKLQSVEREDTDTIFRAYDLAYQMKFQQKTEYHNNKTDVQIIQTLATRNGLNFVGPSTDPGTAPHVSLIQDSKHDWHLAHERAKAANLVIYCRLNTLYAQEPATYTSPIITLVYRGWATPPSPMMFHRWNGRYKLPENFAGRHQQFTRYGRAKGGKRLTGKSDKNQRGHVGLNMTHELHQNKQAYANRMAQASKALNREHAFVFAIRVPPTWEVGPDNRDTVALTQFGKFFSGDYLLDKVHYEHNAHGIVCELTPYRDIAQV